MSDNEYGLVSVIVAFYNAERFLAEAIDSVLAQTYGRWELLLVDDGSVDSGGEIALGYAARHPNRIFCLAHDRHRNLGVCPTRNWGVENSKGEYVAILDADDVWLPHKLEEQVALMETYPGAGLVYGHSEYWHECLVNGQRSITSRVPVLAPAGRLYYPFELLKLSYPLGPFGSPCPSDFLLRREVVKMVGGFEEAFSALPLYEDIAFLAKVYCRVPVFVSERCWDRYRLHENSCTAVTSRENRSDASRRFYFEWLQEYLRGREIKDSEIWDAISRHTRRYRYPGLAAGLRFARSVAKRLLRTLRLIPN